jgi:hypothetical protein
MYQLNDKFGLLADEVVEYCDYSGNGEQNHIEKQNG